MANAVVFSLHTYILVMVSCHQVCFIGSEYNPQSGIPPRWFLPYKDPCECTAIRLGGMHIPASSYCEGAPYYLDELFLSEDPDEIQAYFNCEPSEEGAGKKLVCTTECSSPKPLGMEDGTIQDDRITASSKHKTQYSAWKARLNNNNRWIPSRNDTHRWIEVDLVESTVVTGVITQGWQPAPEKPRYVKKYKVSYQKQPSSDYEYVKDNNGNIKVFISNTDYQTPVTNLFDESVVATVVRIEPTQCHTWCNLRLELLGCRRD
ncbi:lactadherin-like [Patiria miniata]|uniref:F5/8 type C domain-containing protein n=1 Tax=Patiria miniata TaxID=46514 RepID=A0A914AA68_PATMI|nr:lactadherin-like [Patiria miniata]